MPKNEERPTISVAANADLKQDLERLAEADKRTLSSYVRLILEDHVDKSKRKPKSLAGRMI